MKKERRISSDKHFQAVFKKGKSFGNRQLVLYFLEKEQHQFRIGLSVSKKMGNAVTRNRIKRYLRQAFYELNDQIKPQYEYVVISRFPVVALNYKETKRSLIHLFKKTKLFIEK